VVNWTFDDGNGNSITVPQNVNILDVIPPTIIAPPTVTVFPNSAGCTAVGVSLGVPITADNCSIVSTTNDAPAVFLQGTIVVTWTVTDIGGNVTTATQEVTVLPLTSTINPLACDSYIAPDGATYTSSGTYEAIITSTFGCDSTITINLIVDSIETNEVVLNGPIITAVQSNVLYQWVVCDDNYSPVIGANGQSFDLLASNNYAVILTNDNGCVDTSICLSINLDVIIPEVFSPNGDGKNDVFEIEGVLFYPNNVLDIYNRWGNLVHHEEGYQNDWNGINTEAITYGGKDLPVGTYFYVLDLGNGNGEKPFKGYIYITR